MTLRAARWLFRGAPIYGLILLLPLYLLEAKVAVPAPRLNAPEYFYGFIGTAGAFQLMIGGDPVRCRPLMPVAVIAKLSFWIPAPSCAQWAAPRPAPSRPVVGT